MLLNRGRFSLSKKNRLHYFQLHMQVSVEWWERCFEDIFFNHKSKAIVGFLEIFKPSLKNDISSPLHHYKMAVKSRQRSKKEFCGIFQF